MSDAIKGSCHCRAIGYRLAAVPVQATICNCSICRRYGGIWAYGWLDVDVWIDDPKVARAQYIHGDCEIGFHHCVTCGCVTDWTGLTPEPAVETGTGSAGSGPRTRIGVNLRLAEPDAVARIPLRLFDGADAFKNRPVDGRCIADIMV